MKFENQKRIGVDVVGHAVENGGDVLADASAVRARTGCAHFSPGTRKELQGEPLADVGDARRKRTFQKFGHKRRILCNGVKQQFFLFPSPLRQRNFDFVRIVSRSRDERFDAIFVRNPLAAHDVSGVVVGTSARQSVVEVNIAQCVEPLFAPPGVAEGSAFGHKKCSHKKSRKAWELFCFGLQKAKASLSARESWRGTAGRVPNAES